MKTFLWAFSVSALIFACASSTTTGGGGSGGASGAAGTGGGNAGSAGQGTGACADATCSAEQVCVTYRTVGGAQFGPDDAGACAPGRHLEQGGTVCNPDFGYQCGTV